jgi:sugar lactone lactonase YvrE
MSVLTSGWTVLPGEPCELGEGIRLVDDAGAGRAVMVDILAGRLLTVEPRAELLVLDVPLGAVAPRAGGAGWIAAAGPGIALLEPGAAAHWLARPERDAPTAMRMNDGAVDPHGRFWAGSMAYDGTPGAGSLYRVDPDRSVHRALPGLTIPNGPAFDADGTTMYLADSARGLILRLPLDPTTGRLGEPRVFARVDGGSPDGMAVDDDGHLWSAVWGAARLDRYAPDGVLAESLPVPARQPTSVLITPDHRILVTSATVGLAHPGPADGLVLAATVDVTARPTQAWGG